ncbi:alpha/beta hydrolase [Pseudoalteromonas sp. MMG010]|uniref:alpha/beta hydrolase n=1 Tax=Pseudoalteromonas sp. MMG010 TaxID=2822685 RepID=UPI001B3A1375|nr:alpha/beta hydrolase-fold protein [Pseudoalteromonas sp. MMG010]MBQ4832024.1 alpha/beta hydrolase [Pseudoalteromonas sp. MMG010]
MKIIKISFLSVIILISSVFAPQAHTSTLSETPFDFATTLRFDSKILNENRKVNVYLPSGYDKSKPQRYPVIYLLDGSHDEDFVHIAGIVQFGTFSWINMLPPSIVVGIANVDRKRDFTTPSEHPLDKKDLPTHGGAKQFISFLTNELKPLINQRFKTSTQSTLIGQSLGGLLATEILFNHSNMFNRYIIVSPSLWWDYEQLLATEFKPSTEPASVYIAVGKEGPLMERVAKQLHGKVASSLSNSSHVYFNYFEQLDHGDTLHLAVYDAFKKMYAKDSPQAK